MASGPLLLLVWTVLVLTQGLAAELCEYGSLPGTAGLVEGPDSFKWQVFDEQCQIEHLLPDYTGSPSPSQDASYAKGGKEGLSILMLGDSVDRFLLWDVNDTAMDADWSGYESVLRQHWRGAVKTPNFEMVYHFTPGSHELGPYHDNLPYDMGIVSAVPKAFEFHRLLMGRPGPNVVTFSNILWDLGRWLYLSEIAAENETEYYGKPLLKDMEFLPQQLLDEWYHDTNINMDRIEKYAGKDALLIYHNAAFPKLRNLYEAGTWHEQTGTGRRTHIIQLNAMARQVVKERPRWHLVDYGHMTETFIDASHLRDPHHPNTGFMMQVVDIYLNLHNSFGFPMPPKMHEIGDLERYDRDWEDNGRKYQDFHWEEYEVDKQRFLSTLIRKIICCNCHYFNESFFKFSCNVSLPHKKCLLSQASQKFRLYQITRRELILLRHISTLQPLPKTGMTAD